MLCKQFLFQSRSTVALVFKYKLAPQWVRFDGGLVKGGNEVC